MKKICIWCYSQNTDYSWKWAANYRKVPDWVFRWLGIKRKTICESCQSHIIQMAEKITEHGLRRFDVQLNAWRKARWEDMPRELQLLGLCAFLYDHLREMTNGHYFKRRKEHYLQTKKIKGHK